MLDPNTDRGAEWHPGPPIARDFPVEIHVMACKWCGLRAGQDWQDCSEGFRHEMERRVYRPVSA